MKVKSTILNMMMSISSSNNSNIRFGPYSIQASQLFYESSKCYGLVNLKPIVPGHVLIIPKRVIARYKDLSPDEAADLYETVYKISPILEKHYNAEALNIAMQDGKVSGQSVPHVHVHMLPRKPNDFKRNDDVYEHLENQKLDKVIEDERRPRTLEEMAAEATELRTLFPNNVPNV